jgi:hypothetical protein
VLASILGRWFPFVGLHFTFFFGLGFFFVTVGGNVKSTFFDSFVVDDPLALFSFSSRVPLDFRRFGDLCSRCLMALLGFVRGFLFHLSLHFTFSAVLPSFLLIHVFFLSLSLDCLPTYQ